MAFPLHDTSQRSVGSVTLLGQETKNRAPLTWLLTESLEEVTTLQSLRPVTHAPAEARGGHGFTISLLFIPLYLIPLRKEFKTSPPPARQTTCKPQRFSCPPDPPVLELQEYTLSCPTFHRGTRESNSGVCIANTLTP